MANIAQAVNVLQALILTEGEKMVKTPTYHVFDLFKTHQNSALLYSFAENVQVNGIPAISQSASVNCDGEITYTIANCSLDEEFEIDCAVAGAKLTNAKARILTGEVHALNDFDNAENVKPAEYSADLTENGFKVKLPACSVVTVRLS